MNKNFKYTNTIVIGFNDKDDPKRKEFVNMAVSNAMHEHVLHLAATNVLDDKGVKVGDEFRNIELGHSAEVLRVVFDLTENISLAVCDDESLTHACTIISLNELLDIRRWAKINQYKENDDD